MLLTGLKNNYFSCREEKKTKHTHLSQRLSSQINAVCSRAHYKISMVEDALVSPFSDYVSLFNGSLHCHCCSSDWACIICICLCLLALPQSLPRCESDSSPLSWTRRVFVVVYKWAFERMCLHVVWPFFVCACNLYYPICEPNPQMWHFPSLPSRCLAGLREHWAEAKPTAICGNVSTGTDLYRDWLISAFRRLIPMSVFRLMLPGFVRCHTMYLGFDYLYSKSKDAWAV